MQVPAAIVSQQRRAQRGLDALWNHIRIVRPFQNRFWLDDQVAVADESVAADGEMLDHFRTPFFQ